MSITSLAIFAALVSLSCAQLIVPGIFPPTDPEQVFMTNCTTYAQYAQLLHIWHPTCSIDGTYEPMQFHPSNTTMCLSKNGHLLFNGTTPTVKSCTCHRQRFEVQQSALIGAFLPQCDFDGTYAPTQFHASTGYTKCFSADGVELLSGRQIKDCRCPRARYNAQSHGLIGAFIPQCEEDGTYSPMQHHGSTGYTKCFTSTGIELLSGRTIKDCRCPRARYEAQNPGQRVGAFVPQCEEDGTYSAMQYHASTGYVKCFSQDGIQIATGRGIVDCRCHRQRYETQQAGLIGAFTPQCDDDGTYAAMQFHGSTGYTKCFAKDGTEIVSGRGIRACKCPRARYTAQRPGIVGNYIPQCEEDGFYTRRQSHGSTGYSWCVDQEGVQITDSVPPYQSASLIC